MLYVKSLVWLVGFGGTGYILMEFTKPSEKKIQEIRNSSNRHLQNEQAKQKDLFLQKIKEAGAPNSEPIYLRKPIKD